jgi:hypothetical protein
MLQQIHLCEAPRMESYRDLTEAPPETAVSLSLFCSETSGNYIGV